MRKGHTPRPEWKERLFASTRGRVLRLLRQKDRTVNELAELLELSDNTVRMHLASLERDGLAEQSGQRRGLRRPHYAYRLAPAAEQLFLQACDPVLNSLLDVIENQLSAADVDGLLEAAGRRMAEKYAGPGRPAAPAPRTEEAAEALQELGGLFEVQREEGGGVVLQGIRCPFSEVVSRHPQICRLAQAFLAAIVDKPVQERCEQDGARRCRFVVEG